jgi:hypothetical protein
MASTRKIRVISYGVGAMGGLMVQMLASRPDVQLVGAVDKDPAKIGNDLGEIAGLNVQLGVPVCWPPAAVLERVDADVVLLTTTAFAAEALPQILEILDRRINVVCIVQELFFPLNKNREIARIVHERAIEAGVSVTAVGINPGFILDVLLSVCSVPCWQIKSIVAQRNVDFSPYGPDEMVHIGANLTVAEFEEGVRDGSIGHIGLLESTAFVAHCAGLPVDELRQTKEPLIADRDLETEFTRVAEGRVRGFRQRVQGFSGDEVCIDFQMNGLLDPREDLGDVPLGDHCRITGTPNVDIQLKEEISQKGGIGTAAVAVNTIPNLLAAQAGFLTADQLPLPHRWVSERRAIPQKNRSWMQEHQHETG